LDLQTFVLLKSGGRRTDTRRLRQTVKVTPGSKPFRYSKRGGVVYTTKRVSGAPVNTEALKLFKIATN
jgi:predicted phage gp36 major capsid-like protein